MPQILFSTTPVKEQQYVRTATTCPCALLERAKNPMTLTS